MPEQKKNYPFLFFLYFSLLFPFPFLFFLFFYSFSQRKKEKGQELTTPTLEKLSASTLQYFVSPCPICSHMASSSCKRDWEISSNWLTMFLAKNYGSDIKKQKNLLDYNWNTTSRLSIFNRQWVLKEEGREKWVIEKAFNFTICVSLPINKPKMVKFCI